MSAPDPLAICVTIDCALESSSTRPSAVSYTHLGQVPLTEKQLHLLEGLAAIATPVTLHPGENLELNLVDKTIEVSRIAARVGMDDEPEYLRQKNRSCCNR